jgi:hypothetical protein
LQPLQPITEVINGITFSVDSNGVTTITGTATATATFKYSLKGEMVVPTSKQMGGNAYLYFWNDFTSGGTLRFLYDDTLIDYWSINSIDRVLSKFDNLENQTINAVEIRIPSGETRNNATLSPMLTNDGNQASAFVPYWKHSLQKYDGAAWQNATVHEF